jgi:hypothetical protein
LVCFFNGVGSGDERDVTNRIDRIYRIEIY